MNDELQELWEKRKAVLEKWSKLRTEFNAIDAELIDANCKLIDKAREKSLEFSWVYREEGYTAIVDGRVFE